jgi:hypothetical protein
MTAITATAPRAAQGSRLRAARAGLVVLGLGQGGAAGWALLAPHGFYASFPWPGAHWVSALPPFNEHLIRDYGASFLALAVLALIAAWLGDLRLVRVALAVWIVAALPHLIFHLAHADMPAGANGAASLATLAINAALPAALLALISKEAPR